MSQFLIEKFNAGCGENVSASNLITHNRSARRGTFCIPLRRLAEGV
jgi:hypothetical protein